MIAEWAWGEENHFHPASTEEASYALRLAAQARADVATTIGQTRVIEAYVYRDLMRRVLDYSPQDQTVTVESGITRDELGEHLAKEGQRLALDAPGNWPVGGAIAFNGFGPRRHAFGTMKDLILGVTVVRADGTIANAGGRVVKNVAGFDLAKLVVGSAETLAMVTCATLRVHPLPEVTRALRIGDLTPAGVWELVVQIRARRLDPVAIVATRDPASARYHVDLILEGFASGVSAKVELAASIAAEASRTAEDLEPADVAAADESARQAGPLRLRITAPAADFAEVAASLDGLRGGLDASHECAYPSLGVTVLAGCPSDMTSSNTAIALARLEAERRGGSLIVEATPADGVRLLDRWGTLPPAFFIMKQLKARFDPEGRLNPGAFVGGL